MNDDIQKLLKDRYYLDNENKWSDIAKRVGALYEPITEHIDRMEFVPSSPTLMNANTNGERQGTLSSCFPMNIDDSMESIMESMKECALVTKSCGGVGLDFSPLRGKNESVKGTGKKSGGVMSFIGIYDAVLEGVRQGVRRGAGMSLLSISHPQILDFIDAKKNLNVYNRSNFSVKIPNSFYETLEKTPDKIFQTINITDGKKNDLVDNEGKVYTYKMLWDKIIDSAWTMAEPGIINSDYILERSTLSHIDTRELTNPCFSGDTIIKDTNGKKYTFKELADKKLEIEVYSLNTNGDIIKTKLLKPRLTAKKVQIIKIYFENNTSLKVTPNHYFINDLGKRIQAIDSLNKYVKIVTNDVTNIYAKKNTLVLWNTMQCENCNTYLDKPIEDEHITFCSLKCKNEYLDKQAYYKNNIISTLKVTKLEVDEIIDVYDGTVPILHNFLVPLDKDTFVASGQCSEFVTTVPYTSCNLGSIDVSKFVDEHKQIKWTKLHNLIRKSTRFLNAVIDNNNYPIQKIKDVSHASRPIGLGMMGFAHLLYKMGIPYDSKEAKTIATKLMKTFTLYGMDESIELAKENKQSFKWFDYDVYIKANKRLFAHSEKYIIGLKDKIKKYGIYNSSLTSVAPTGSLSTIVCCSSGIEPVFGLVYTRKIETGNKQYTEIYVVDPVFEKYIENKYSENKNDIYKYVSSNKGSVKGCKYLTSEEQSIFVTAGDISPSWHLEILEPFANFVSLSISKTINLPKDATKEQTADVYLNAHKKGVIGVTVYRDGCREGILVHKSGDEKDTNTVDRREAPKRPQDLDCDIKIVKIKNDTIVILVGKFKGMIYEMFVAAIDEKDKEKLQKYEQGIIRKVKTNHYRLISGDDVLVDNLGKFGTTVERSLARLISMSLRHGVPLKFIVEQLNKSDDFTAFDKSVSRILKQYIKDGEVYASELCPECKSKLIYFDGCVKCSNCFWSKC